MAYVNICTPGEKVTERWFLTATTKGRSSEEIEAAVYPGEYVIYGDSCPNNVKEFVRKLANMRTEDIWQLDEFKYNHVFMRAYMYARNEPAFDSTRRHIVCAFDPTSPNPDDTNIALQSFEQSKTPGKEGELVSTIRNIYARNSKTGFFTLRGDDRGEQILCMVECGGMLPNNGIFDENNNPVAPGSLPYHPPDSKLLSIEYSLNRPIYVASLRFIELLKDGSEVTHAQCVIHDPNRYPTWSGEVIFQ